MAQICVFDIETIPDPKLVRKIYGFVGSDEEVSILAIKDQEEKTTSGFLPTCFHQTVAISAVICDDFGKFEKVNTIKGKNEEDIIKQFMGYINKYSPRLVSFNGKGFDMPALVLRALKYNIDCLNYLNTKDKWNNYRSKFAENMHCDLFEQLSSFGAARGIKLDTVCSMANLPGKYDVSGDEVMKLYYEGKIDKINEYCESDVLNTYWLFLKYELIKGNLSMEDYLRNLSLMSEYLIQNKKDMGYTQVFAGHIEKELTNYIQE